MLVLLSGVIATLAAVIAVKLVFGELSQSITIQSERLGVLESTNKAHGTMLSNLSQRVSTLEAEKRKIEDVAIQLVRAVESMSAIEARMTVAASRLENGHATSISGVADRDSLNVVEGAR